MTTSVISSIYQLKLENEWKIIKKQKNHTLTHYNPYSPLFYVVLSSVKLFDNSFHQKVPYKKELICAFMNIHENLKIEEKIIV